MNPFGKIWACFRIFWVGEISSLICITWLWWIHHASVSKICDYIFRQGRSGFPERFSHRFGNGMKASEVPICMIYFRGVKCHVFDKVLNVEESCKGLWCRTEWPKTLLMEERFVNQLILENVQFLQPMCQYISTVVRRVSSINSSIMCSLICLQKL